MGAVVKIDRDAIDKRPLPHNLEAEQLVIGALLRENEYYAKVANHLKEADFYDQVLGSIYGVIAEMIEGGRVASPVSLRPFAEMIEMGSGNAVDFLMALWNAAPKKLTDAIEYAKIVQNEAINRALYTIHKEALDEILDARRIESAPKRIDRHVAMMESLRPSLASTSGFESFERAAERAVDIAARAYDRGAVLAGLSTGLRRLDEALGGLHRSDLVTLAGATGMGKTALAINISHAVARGLLERQREGEKTGVVGFFSLEMPADQIAQRILAEHSRISGWRLRKGGVSEGEFASFADAARELRTLPIEIDATGGISISQLMLRARALNKRRGLEVLVVDYLQLVKGTDRGRRETNRVQEVAEITGGLKALAKELDIPVIALSQVSRDIAKREDKRPMLSDLRESGSIEMDSDVVMFAYREEYYLWKAKPKQGAENYAAWESAYERARGRADIIIAKNRHGPEDTIAVGFDATLTLFKDEMPEELAPAGAPAKKERKKALKLIKEATTALGILKNLLITSSVANDGHVNQAARHAKLVPYTLWREKCAEELLDSDRGEKAAAALMEKIVKDLRAPSSGHPPLIGRAGSDGGPYVWLIERDQ